MKKQLQQVINYLLYFALSSSSAIASEKISLGPDPELAIHSKARGLRIPTGVLCAIAAVESNYNPSAERYEPSLKDKSVGLCQILTKTAGKLEETFEDLPRLGSGDELVASLKMPEINLQYASKLLELGLERYGSLELAVAAYNAGQSTPEIASYQQMLDDLGYDRKADGVLGPRSRASIKKFQKDNGLKVDGILGKLTRQKIQEICRQRNPNKKIPKGIIPQNSITPDYVARVMALAESHYSSSN